MYVHTHTRCLKTKVKEVFFMIFCGLYKSLAKVLKDTNVWTRPELHAFNTRVYWAYNKNIRQNGESSNANTTYPAWATITSGAWLHKKPKDEYKHTTRIWKKNSFYIGEVNSPNTSNNFLKSFRNYCQR